MFLGDFFESSWSAGTGVLKNTNSTFFKNTQGRCPGPRHTVDVLCTARVCSCFGDLVSGILWNTGTHLIFASQVVYQLASRDLVNTGNGAWSCKKC